MGLVDRSRSCKAARRVKQRGKSHRRKENPRKHEFPSASEEKGLGGEGTGPGEGLILGKRWGKRTVKGLAPYLGGSIGEEVVAGNGFSGFRLVDENIY